MTSQPLLELPGGLGGAHPSSFSCSKLKLDGLFQQWFSLPQNQKLVMQLLEDVKQGKPLSGSQLRRLHAHSSHGAFSSGPQPPMSPRKSGATSPFSPSRRASMGLSPRPSVQPPPAIPQFYFPRAGGGAAAASARAASDQVEAFFAVYPEGLSLENLKTLLRQAFDLPGYLAYPIFHRLVGGQQQHGEAGQEGEANADDDPMADQARKAGGAGGEGPGEGGAAEAGALSPMEEEGEEEGAGGAGRARGAGPGTGGGGVGDASSGEAGTGTGAGAGAGSSPGSSSPGAAAVSAAAAAAAGEAGEAEGASSLAPLSSSSEGQPPLVSRESLVGWLEARQFASASPARRAFEALRRDGATGVTRADVRPVLAGILVSHPGLEFLSTSPEFQERYAETVIARIFHELARGAPVRELSAREVARGDLRGALAELESLDDVNRASRFFSYEHFYVIYCRFWDLDADHDFRLSRDDLLRYGNHALTFRIVDRLFSPDVRCDGGGGGGGGEAGAGAGAGAGAEGEGGGEEGEGGATGGAGAGGRSASSAAGAGGLPSSAPESPSAGAPDSASAALDEAAAALDRDTIGYEDFVRFVLSEEDKTTEESLAYWFRAVDLDGDGTLDGSELLHFYEEQAHRMECLSAEAVGFDDVMAQMCDALRPEDPTAITLADLRRAKPLSGTLFDVLFNLNKFIAFETRDPFLARAEREDGAASDWDRFARAEYARLAVEDDAEADGAAWGSGADEEPWADDA